MAAAPGLQVRGPAAPPTVVAEGKAVAQSSEIGFARDAVAANTAPGDPLQNVNFGTAAPAMVIRTGQAYIEVEKVDAAVLKIRQLAAQYSGYITNSSVTGGRDQIRQATLELKLPSPKSTKPLDRSRRSARSRLFRPMHRMSARSSST